MYYGNTEASNLSDKTNTFVDVLDNLIAFYSLDEGTGTTAHDGSSNNLDGTLGSAATWTTGKIDNAVSFDNTANAYIDLGNSGLLNPASAISVSAWFKLNSLSPSGDWNYIAAREQSSYPWILREQAEGTLLWYVRTETDNGYEVTTTVSANTWYHVVGTYGNGEIKLYLDGSEVASDTFTAENIKQTSDKTLIGASYYGSSYCRNMDGIIDEVAIFSDVLTASEVTNIYNNRGLANGNELLIRKYADPEPSTSISYEGVA